MTRDDAAANWAALYEICAEATITLARGLTPEQLATTVPATPEWTVKDVIAHAAGVASDAATGRMDGAPGPAWTARHVAERTGKSAAELADEIAATTPLVRAVVTALVAAGAQPAPVWDRSVHLADVAEALDLGVPPPVTWRPVLDSLAEARLASLPLTVHYDHEVVGAGGPEVTVDPYELFRAIFSRRSRAQIRDWAGDSVPDERLDAIAIFGPRTDDQPQP